MKNSIGMRRTLAITAGLLCGGSLVAFSLNQSTAVVWAETAIAEEPTQPDMVLTEENSEKTVGAYVGNLIEVRLESNATTGYEWNIVKQDEKALISVGKPKFVAPTNDGAGTPGQQIFQFEAKKAGATKLELGYARPFEKGKPPVQTFAVTINIMSPAK